MSREEMYDNDKRAEAHKKNDSLEERLRKLNSIIGQIPPENPTIPVNPIVLIMGCARSGSTLMLQYLASTGIFSYPSNLIARYYKNPLIGILSQQVLKDMITEANTSFESNLGKTKGLLAPSEYWYFWREYFQFSKFNIMNQEDIEAVDVAKFLQQLSAFEENTGLPLAMKGMILNWNIPVLHNIYPKFIYINLKRDQISNAKSLLSARRNYFNDESQWYSFRPVEYDNLVEMSPVEQVVGQVHYTEKAIDKGLEVIPESNKINIDYEEFCRNPHGLLIDIREKFSELGRPLSIPENTNEVFMVSNKSNISADENEEFIKAHAQYD